MKPIVGQLYTLRRAPITTSKGKHKVAIDLFHPVHSNFKKYKEGTLLVYISDHVANPDYDKDGGWHTVYSQEYGLREVYSSAENKEIEFIPCK